MADEHYRSCDSYEMKGVPDEIATAAVREITASLDRDIELWKDSIRQAQKILAARKKARATLDIPRADGYNPPE